MKRTWVRGPRTTVEGKDSKGRPVVLTGKNGGPVIHQTVELHLTPRERS